MGGDTILAHVSFLIQRSLGIWFSVWAIRYAAKADYKISNTARAVRWSVVGIGYLLAASLPGPAVVRLVPGFAGLSFLCWPNLAYHATNFLVEWPTAKGRIGSARDDGSRSVVTYSFEVGESVFGGTTRLKLNSFNGYSEGQQVIVAYDPLNPDQSRILPDQGSGRQ